MDNEKYNYSDTIPIDLSWVAWYLIELREEGKLSYQEFYNLVWSLCDG